MISEKEMGFYRDYTAFTLEYRIGDPINIQTSYGPRLGARLVNINRDASTDATTLIISTTEYGVEAIDINETAPLVAVTVGDPITVEPLSSIPTEKVLAYTVGVRRIGFLM